MAAQSEVSKVPDFGWVKGKTALQELTSTSTDPNVVANEKAKHSGDKRRTKVMGDLFI